MNEPNYVLLYKGADGDIPCFVGARQECRDFANKEPGRVFGLYAVWNDLNPVLVEVFRGEE